MKNRKREICTSGEVQWDIGAALGAADGADESTSPQFGISGWRGNERIVQKCPAYRQ
jgi:hypothetical protein